MHIYLHTAAAHGPCKGTHKAVAYGSPGPTGCTVVLDPHPSFVAADEKRVWVFVCLEGRAAGGLQKWTSTGRAQSATAILCYCAPPCSIV